MTLRNRLEATLRLTQELAACRGRNPLVLGIARGSVSMAKVIADAIRGQLDVVLARKITAPGNPDVTVGAVTDDGHVHMSAAAEVLGVRRDDVAAQTEAALADLRRRRAGYRHVRTPVHPGGREVIVVDDGALSGATLAAVVRATRLRKPSRLTVAVPVASRAVAEGLAREVDQFVCLERPERVADLSRHYYSFPKVSEREVLTTLLSAGLAPSLRRPG